MSGSAGTLSRRDFFRASAGGGFALGSLFGLGLDLRAAQDETRHAKFVNTREVPSVCPYCAVGCSQLISVNTKTKQIVNIEGNPASPINRGTLCPKGAATYQLVVNDNRIKKVLYRAPRSDRWEEKPLDWAMDQIAKRVKEMRDKPGNFVEWTDKDKDGNPLKDKDGNQTKKLVNQLMAIGSLGGATMDNEWNYLQSKLMRALGVVNLENQARI
jgi:formate dehydrogenase major subunit